MTEFHVLFSMDPNALTEELSSIPHGYMTTNQIRDIILSVAANAKAEQWTAFFLSILKQPRLRSFVNKMFEDLVLSWFYTHSNDYIPCVTAQGTSPSLHIPTCRKNHMVITFSNKNTMRMDIHTKALPLLLLLPKFPAYAIILTKRFGIIIEITTFDSHTMDGPAFDTIVDHLPCAAK